MTTNEMKQMLEKLLAENAELKAKVSEPAPVIELDIKDGTTTISVPVFDVPKDSSNGKSIILGGLYSKAKLNGRDCRISCNIIAKKN